MGGKGSGRKPKYNKLTLSASIKEYRLWMSIHDRCYNPYSESYKYYGAKGIKLWRPWLESFDLFLKDIGYAPNNDSCLIRLDTTKDYEPGNVKWGTKLETNRNSKQAKVTLNIANKIREEYKAKHTTQKILAIKYGVSRETIRDIVANKTWRIE